MEKELLQRAIDSILHGSSQVITTTNSDGSASHQQVRINDLRINLVDKLAQKLVETEEFKKIFLSVFTGDVIKKIQEKAVESAKFADLPYFVRQRLEKEMNNTKLEIKSYKLIAESIIKD